MDEKKTLSGTAYYLIEDYCLGKEEAGRYYLYQNGKWEPDTENRIMDHKVGFDPLEPEDSPYRFGNYSVMAEMQEISENEAISLIRKLEKKMKS
ncbi:MAG: hypothetical protein LIP12_14020 [Clostridiales bacterium]|nr:hypothetical protein [Clostridiales bacterium]